MSAISFVEDIEGADAYNQYLRIVGQTRLRENLPDGLLLHAAGPTPLGCRIVAVWDSEESLTRFFRNRLQPAMNIVGPPPGNPVVEINAVTVLLRPRNRRQPLRGPLNLDGA